MQNNKNVQIAFIASFLFLISAVSISQVGLELLRGDQPNVIQLFLKQPSQKNLRLYEKTLESNNWVSEYIQPIMRKWQFLFLHDSGKKAVMGDDGWFFFKKGIEYLSKRHDVDPQAETGWEDALESITDFDKHLADRGIKLFVMPVPGKASVYPEYLSGHKMDRALNEKTRQLIEKLIALNIGTIDLSVLMSKEKQISKKDLYLKQDTHWSPDGMHFSAQEVVKKLIASGFTQKGTHEYELKKVEMSRQGDVLGMLQISGISDRYPDENVGCHQVVDAKSNQIYEDDPNADVLIIGDSFLRIYERDEPYAAGFVSHVAHELGKPVASIVNDGGASTLVRQELYRKPELLKNKKVLIWEFVERDIFYGAEGWQKVKLPKVQ